jgi:putative membrane protein
MRQVRAVLIALILPFAAVAHDGKPHDFEDLIWSWSFDPLVVTLLAASAIAYIVGLRALWRSAGRGNGITVGESLAFAGGWLSMFVALVSPLHPWGEVLFSAHMTQHELLMLVSAPLFVLGRPFVAAMWSLPEKARSPVVAILHDAQLKRVWRSVTAPLFAFVIHAVALWVWHIPVLFQATLRSDVVHTFQHASFFLSALLFWWALIYQRRSARSYGAGVLYLFSTSMHSGLLGVLLTLSTKAIYPAYAATTTSWGLTPIEDQQLGGLIMWIPAGIVYIFAALVMFAAWLRESDRRPFAQLPAVEARR